MTDEAMSPLRRRMIEDMMIRKLAPKTQQGYIRVVKDFAVFLGRSPDTASFEDIRRFQLHLTTVDQLLRKALAVLDASGTADGFHNLGGRDIMDKIS
jgi:hypothetical protein